jgi:death-on-curing protein
VGPGVLEAALFRPQTGYYEDIVIEAAALLESLAINHPFVDGNKRIAFAAADVFLRINGWRLRPPPMQIHAEMIAVFETGTFDIAHLEPWLRGFAVIAE